MVSPCTATKVIEVSDSEAIEGAAAHLLYALTIPRPFDSLFAERYRSFRFLSSRHSTSIAGALLHNAAISTSACARRSCGCSSVDLIYFTFDDGV